MVLPHKTFSLGLKKQLMKNILPSQRHQFSLPAGMTYLNCAYMGPTPKAAEAAGVAALMKKSQPWEVQLSDFFAPVDEVRRLFAQLINAEGPGRIAVVPSVSHGMGSVTKNIHPEPGQNIVMLEEQFPSNYYSWKRLADESGASIRTVGPPDTLVNRGEKWNEKLLESIDDQTVAVTLPHSHWADGTLFDLAAVRQRSREVGAFLVIDGTQSVGALPFDVADIQPDALICGAYKWLLGPYTSGLAYFGEAFDDGVPIEENWINRLDSDNFQNLVKYQPAYQPEAQRYNMGQQSQFVAVAMLKESLKMLLGWGMGNIQNYCEAITGPSLGRLGGMGVWVEEPVFRGEHLFGLRLPEGADLETLKTRADAANLFVSFRGNAVRVSPHLYNDGGDMEKLEGLIRECL